MSALSTITTPAVHGRRSTVKSAQATETAVVKQPEAATATATGTQPGAFRRVAGKVVKGIGVGMLVLAAVVFLLLAIGPRILGYQTSTMLTGSMAPLINPGDVVVTVPTPITDVKVGDIITYHIPVEDQRVETHRITEITTTADGGIAVQTKGDANNGIDPWIATLQGKTVDKQIATIPHVGNAIRTLREPIVMNTLMYGAPAILVIGMLASIWTKNPNKTTPEDTAGAGDETAA
ncbi:signal peptidase I [Arthrobacter sp. ISL-95]|uniref:signal peptidase I n=1 Tax=Arthrobacter sp. ISL-95 TaxID=2819116 RepID=UPI001BE760B5|nr:signal peptidase I [Arthrobacter sp. ISL-95]MBT2585926.1 signal peptidase I [Arthrobacter sp. ISL-95]